jgi:hypothetical protein
MKSITLLLLLTASVSLAENRSITTDGVFWKGLTDSMKVAFLIGYGSGYLSSSTDVGGQLIKRNQLTEEALKALTKDRDPNAISFGTLEDGVDSCYKDFRNERVSVNVCIDWVVMGVNGDSDSARSQFLEWARHVYASQ